jgi:hypothetical protein
MRYATRKQEFTSLRLLSATNFFMCLMPERCPIGSEPRAAANRESVQHDVDAFRLSMDTCFHNGCKLGNHHVLVSQDDDE